MSEMSGNTRSVVIVLAMMFTFIISIMVIQVAAYNALPDNWSRQDYTTWMEFTAENTLTIGGVLLAGGMASLVGVIAKGQFEKNGDSHEQ